MTCIHVRNGIYISKLEGCVSVDSSIVQVSDRGFDRGEIDHCKSVNTTVSSVESTVTLISFKKELRFLDVPPVPRYETDFIVTGTLTRHHSQSPSDLRSPDPTINLIAFCRDSCRPAITSTSTGDCNIATSISKPI